MGWKAKLLAAFLAVLFLASGLWPLALGIIVYLAYSFRRRQAPDAASGHSPLRLARLLIGVTLIALAAVAFISGGTYSPVVFLVAGVLVLMSPEAARRLASGVSPVADSILLRSRNVPFIWYSLAELKAGSGEFPRAASGFEGTLIVFTQTGKSFCLVRCYALGRSEAEAKVLHQLRSSATRGTGAYLLPLDAQEACEVLRWRLSQAPRLASQLPASATWIEGILVMECGAGFVSRAAAHQLLGGSSQPAIPSSGTTLGRPPMVWEVMEAISKRTRWPEPDSFSNLLDSLAATRNVPLGERLAKLEESEGKLVIHTLSGDQVLASRSKVRAIVSIYS
jgi:hypothetical protein